MKQGVILDTLRGQIMSGQVAPGGRLPLRTEMEKTFQVSGVTLQRALDRLTRDGYVYARGKAGTFVAQYPPHLFQYGLVFPHTPSDSAAWRHYWTAVCNEAARLTRTGPRRLLLYYGLDFPGQSEDHQKLLRDIEHHRLAGLIFASPMVNLTDTPVMTTPGLPRAVMAETPLGFPAVNIDKRSFVTRSMDYLTSQGCRKIAVVDGAGIFRGPAERKNWLEEMARRGINSGSHWIQGVDVSYPQCTSSLVELLFHPPAAESPDGLIVADDNLIQAVIAGIMAAGVRVPDQVKIVAHCNFPWPTPGALPTKRLGFDMREWLHACLDCIDQQRRGETPLPMLRIPARFEEEVSLQQHESLIPAGA